jgi:hypothetical protein
VQKAAALPIRYETVHAACFVVGSNKMLVERVGQGNMHMLLLRKHKNILNIFCVAVVLMWSLKNRNCMVSCVFMWTQKWEKCAHSSRNSEQYFYQMSQYSAAGVVTRPQAGRPRNHGLVPGTDNRFLCPKHPDQLWGPPSLLLLDTVVCFLGSKVADMCC